PYEEFLRNRVFGPLGMNDTTFYPTPKQQKRVPPIYDRKDGKLVSRPNTLIALPVNAKYPIPAGGLYSTGGDLAKLYQAMLGNGTLGKITILRAASVAEMTRLQTDDVRAGFTPG